MNRHEIAPGAFVSHIGGEKFKRCRVVLRLVAPSERATATELAVLPHVLSRRCAAIPDATALSRRLFSLYGADVSSESYTVGGNRILSIGVSGLKSAYALSGEDLEGEYVRLACDMLFAPVLENGVFSAEDVAIEREKQADFLRGEMNEKRSYCLHQARRKLFGDSPMGVESSGYLEDIDKVTPQSMYTAYCDFLQKAQIEVSVLGMPAGGAAAEVEKHLRQAGRAPVPLAPAAVAPQQPQASYEEPMDTIQGKLCILLTNGQVPNARAGVVMRMATALLGGLPTSRLFLNVREKQSLCYYCAANYGPFTGVLTIDSGVEHENLHKAAKAIEQEVRNMQAAPVTPQELEYARLAMAGAFKTAQDSPSALENWIFTEWMRGTNLTMDEYAALLQDVSTDEVQQALAGFTPALQYAITQKEALV